MMDILITTVGILTIYFGLLSLFMADDFGIFLGLGGIICFSAYIWNKYDFAIAIVVR